MENPEFLKNKYTDLNKSPEVESAARRSKARTSTELPMTNVEGRIQNYLDRLKEIFENPDKDKRERGIAFVKNQLHEQFAIKPEDIPEAYFDSIKRRHRQEGHGDIEIPDDYRQELSETVIADQIRSLDSWIDYLASDDAKYPDWLKYFTVRSILRMGRYDKKRRSFTERTGGTIAPFADLNREALAIVLDSFERQANGQSPKFGYDISEDAKSQFLESLRNKNFAKAYAVAIEEFKPIADELLQITDGAWRTYPRGSDPKVLVESIAPYGTGWCLRGESMAARYLVRDQNELQVYYSLDKDDNPTVPRVVTVVNAQGQLTEVRGVAPDENLDEYIGPVVEAKLKEFPDGDAYRKKSEDMRLLTALERKREKDEPFTKDELVFLYEINLPVEGFGYERDPRIEELRKDRNTKEDMPVVFECSREQIAGTPGEISENTRAYVGKLEPGIFYLLQKHNIEHVYTSFPEGKIIKYDIETGGKTKDQLMKKLKEKNIYLSAWSIDIFEKMETSAKTEKAELVCLTVRDLGFPNGATTDEIYKRAMELGLDLCEAEIGPHLRLQYSGKDEMLIAMEQITGRYGSPHVFFLACSGARLEFDASHINSSIRWRADLKFVFRFRKLET